MRTRFTLTNTSFTFNHFKLLSLPDEIKDFFELTFVKPGRMSAGMTCSIIIEFEPKINKDIFSSIPLLAQTGPFEIPLICTTKKIVPAISCQVLPLGTVVLGEKITGKIRVTNNGALPTRYKIQQPIGVPTTDEFEFDAETDELVNVPPPPGIPQPDVLTYQVGHFFFPSYFQILSLCAQTLTGQCIFFSVPILSFFFFFFFFFLLSFSFPTRSRLTSHRTHRST
jgi:hypothetical protein